MNLIELINNFVEDAVYTDSFIYVNCPVIFIGDILATLKNRGHETDVVFFQLVNKGTEGIKTDAPKVHYQVVIPDAKRRMKYRERVKGCETTSLPKVGVPVLRYWRRIECSHLATAVLENLDNL